MAEKQYSSDGIVRNNWPRWTEQSDRRWLRAWTIRLRQPVPDSDALESQAVGDEAVAAIATMASDGRTLHVRTETSGEAWSDELFFLSAFRMFKRIEGRYGTIEAIQDQPRDEWRPFRSVASDRASLLNDIGEATVQAANKGEQAMPITGEKPGKGTYKCKKCGQLVTLDDATDTLPPCPKCEHTEFDKVA